MAYTKQVVWKYPFADQNLDIGFHGLRFTRVLLDVPRPDLTRDIWDFDVFPAVSGENFTSVVEMNTSVAYHTETLKVYANGILVISEESELSVKNTFSIDIDIISGKYVHCEYIPSEVSKFLGDNTTFLENMYGIVTTVDYSSKLRETIQLMRNYLDVMRTTLNITPDLWIVGYAKM